MHECPACRQACDCDSDDLWTDIVPKECSCPCWKERDWDELDDFEEQLDGGECEPEEDWPDMFGPGD